MRSSVVVTSDPCRIGLVDCGRGFSGLFFFWGELLAGFCLKFLEDFINCNIVASVVVSYEEIISPVRGIVACTGAVMALYFTGEGSLSID